MRGHDWVLVLFAAIRKRSGLWMVQDFDLSVPVSPPHGRKRQDSHHHVRSCGIVYKTTSG